MKKILSKDSVSLSQTSENKHIKITGKLLTIIPVAKKSDSSSAKIERRPAKSSDTSLSIHGANPYGNVNKIVKTLISEQLSESINKYLEIKQLRVTDTGVLDSVSSFSPSKYRV